MPDPTGDDIRLPLQGVSYDAGYDSRRTIPAVPYTPMPPSVVKRIPELQVWYQDFYKQLENWRRQVDFVLNNDRQSSVVQPPAPGP